jgi:hypothetical protein
MGALEMWVALFCIDSNPASLSRGPARLAARVEVKEHP